MKEYLVKRKYDTNREHSVYIVKAKDSKEAINKVLDKYFGGGFSLSRDTLVACNLESLHSSVGGIIEV